KPNGGARAHGSIPSAPRGRQRRPLPALPFRSRTSREPLAPCPDCAGRRPNRAAFARGSIPSAPRGRQRRPLQALPFRSRAVLQRRPIGSDGFFNLRRFSLALPEREERGAQIDQRLSPFGRYSLAVLLL